MAKQKSKYPRKKNPLYAIWNGMMRRCYNPSCIDYKYYGGRGIRVSNKWKNFDNFVEDMQSNYKKGLTIGRADNKSGYRLDNCRWESMKEQCQNRRSCNYLINPITKEKKTLTEWANFFGLSRNTITSRIRIGYKDFKALVSKKHGIRHGKIKHNYTKEARSVRD